jgi:ABC-type long-subunit fatty acid transport system fused permease/ATPase subunit
MSNHLTKSIMETIAKKEPEKKQLVIFKRALVWTLLGVFTFLSSLLITLFTLDIVEKFPLNLRFFPFELLLLAFILTFVSYLIFRSTKTPISKDRLKLGVLIMAAVLVLSFAGATVIQSNIFGIRQHERRFNGEFNRRRFPQEKPKPRTSPTFNNNFVD